MNLKELIDNNAEEIVVKGSYNDVHCAFSIYDKQNKYEFVKILSDNSLLFKLKQKDVVMEYKLPKDYKKPDEFNPVKFTSYGYNSPISLTFDSEARKMLERNNKEAEEFIMSKINMVVDVNKEELVKALQYDRNQYEKGYSDAKRQYDRGHGHWILERSYGDGKSDYCCSVCNYDDTMYDNLLSFYKYCPYCGAKMDEEEEE